MEEQRRKIIFIVVLAFLIVAGSFYSFWQKKSVDEHGTSGEALAKGTKTIDEKPNEMMVYISGAVNKPGVFKLRHNARVIDAVNMAGGLTLEADGAKTNMAQPLKDGMHINVVSKVVSSSGGGNMPSNSGKGTGSTVININTADKSSLDTLPGIGPALAERIIQYRQTNGSFSEIEGLKKVPGVGASKFDKMKDKITI
jgi:competence protein ComEA